MFEKRILPFSEEQRRELLEAGYVIVHRSPTESMIKAMLSARSLENLPINIDIEKAFHRAISESIRLQRSQVVNGSQVVNATPGGSDQEPFPPE